MIWDILRHDVFAQYTVGDNMRYTYIEHIVKDTNSYRKSKRCRTDWSSCVGELCQINHRD